jgi:hypothetical protein
MLVIQLDPGVTGAALFGGEKDKGEWVYGPFSSERLVCK